MTLPSPETQRTLEEDHRWPQLVFRWHGRRGFAGAIYPSACGAPPRRRPCRVSGRALSISRGGPACSRRAGSPGSRTLRYAAGAAAARPAACGSAEKRQDLSAFSRTSGGCSAGRARAQHPPRLSAAAARRGRGRSVVSGHRHGRRGRAPASTRRAASRRSRSCSPTSRLHALAEGRLPYDVVFVLNRYFASVGRAVEQVGGQGRQIHRRRGDGAVRGGKRAPRRDADKRWPPLG